MKKSHSIEHAMVQLVDQIHGSFEKGIYKFEVFIYLSKAFDTIDHLLLKEVEYYRVKNANLAWFRGCLTNQMIAKVI